MNKDEKVKYMVDRLNFLKNNWNGKMNAVGSELKFIESLLDDNYILIDKYVKALDKVTLLCPNEHEYKVKPSKFRVGDRCPICSKNSKSAAASEFYKLADELNYTVIDKYLDAHSKVKMTCNNNHKLYISPHDFKSGTRCKVCREENLKNEFIDGISKDNYKIIGEYINTITKVEVECPKGHRYKVKPGSFRSGNRCKKCRGIEHSFKMLSHKAKDEFFDKLKENNCKINTNYINSTEKLDVICQHGHITNISPRDFKYCKECHKNNLYNLSISKMNKKLQNEGYEIISYDKNHIEVKCKEGHIYKTMLKYAQAGNRCSICGGSDKNHAINIFTSAAGEEGYKIVDEYINANTNINMICPEGHNWSINPKRFRSGERCSICSGTNKALGKSTFYDLANKLNYKVIGEYTGAREHVLMRCPRGHDWSATPDNFKRGRRCSECNVKSQGEEVVKEQLELNNITFIREKMFKDLTGLGGRKLRFDFYIPEHNSVIEVNGEGHYELDTYLNNNNTIEHDKIKEKWCKRKNIKMFNIEYITLKMDKNKVLENVKAETISIINSNFKS